MSGVNDEGQVPVAEVLDMLKEQPVKRGRGRPRVYADAAARQAAYRDRHGKQYSVILPPDVAQAFDAYMSRHRMNVNPEASNSDVLVDLLRKQLFRKR